MLRRLVKYLDKMFELRNRVETFRDKRKDPDISAQKIWLSIFSMFVLRYRSFNQLEKELHRPGRLRNLVGGQAISADTIGYSCVRFHLEGPRQLLAVVNRKAWRSKAIQADLPQSYRVVAVDGHELFASYSRCCDQCLVREIIVNGQPVKQYYHRVVAAQWVGVTPPGILGFEMVRPGEGEVVAARRLMDRIFQSYGRLIDVITADALYLEAPFIQKVLEAGKHFVIVLKQENRDLYKDAEGLRAILNPTLVQQGNKTSLIWDMSNLTTFTTLGRPVRVVWADEETVKNVFNGGKRQQTTVNETWVWVTDLPAETVPAILIQRWGHDRWDLENRGFNELSNLWHMDHCFIHDVTAIELLLITLAIAFITTYLFFERNLKRQARRHLDRSALAQWFRDDLSLLSKNDDWRRARSPS